MTNLRLTEGEKERLFQSINFFDDEADELWPEIEKILTARVAYVWDVARASGMDTGLSIGEALQGLAPYPTLPPNPYRNGVDNG